MSDVDLVDIEDDENHENEKTCPSDVDEEEFGESEIRPSLVANGRPRRVGCIWNTPIGLVATFFLASKVIDLAAHVLLEQKKERQAENKDV